VLAAHPRVDPARIAPMGFSGGGQRVLYAGMTRFQAVHGPQGAAFAAYLPFYPSCGTVFREDERLSGRPVRIHHGIPDDYVPAAPCRCYVERLRKAGQDVTEYPAAHHSFDNAAAAPRPVEQIPARDVQARVITPRRASRRRRAAGLARPRSSIR
jgi:dienelactone hydrolase